MIINLSEQKVQYIVNVLAERPYKESAETIADIITQSRKQAEVVEEAPITPTVGDEA